MTGLRASDVRAIQCARRRQIAAAAAAAELSAVDAAIAERSLLGRPRGVGARLQVAGLELRRAQLAKVAR